MSVGLQQIKTKQINYLNSSQNESLQLKPSFCSTFGDFVYSSRRSLALQPHLLQPKLTVGPPDDEYEREADRVADQVMSMPEQKVQRACPKCDEEEEKIQSKPLVEQITPLMQRKAETEEEEEKKAQAKRLDGTGQRHKEAHEKSPILQIKFDQCLKKRSLMRSSIKARHSTAPAIVHDVLRSSGQPLDASTRAFVEPQFGHEFRQVMVHADTRAAESAVAVDALAYTVGRDIVFGQNQYAPHTSAGQRLLMHELAHVVQQGGSCPQGNLSDMNSVTKNIPYEREAKADSNGLTDIPSLRLSASKPSLQRVPGQQTLRDKICYKPGRTPIRRAEDCDSREPENCPTYEQWLNTFIRLTTFLSSDTAPGGVEESMHNVLGEPAARPVDKPNAPFEQKSPQVLGPQVSDKFIDHPTDLWVKTCLPDNLRETAYKLPSDCADIAVILRHVWLSSHNRTEVYGTWVVGDRAGGAGSQRILGIMNKVFSGNVAYMINAYTDSKGTALRSFADLQNLLHPGDILVWEHHEAGLGTPRTGGHTQTIVNVSRYQEKITRIDVLQGNQPISKESAKEIRQSIGRGAPSEAALRNAPGRRIEANELTGYDLRDLKLPQSSGKATSPAINVWTWSDGHTTLVAAGPPASAPRPAMSSQGGKRLRRISDWFVPIRRSGRDNLHSVFEAALIELRSMVEGGQIGLDTDAESLGKTAGERLWNLAHQAKDLGEESHFRPLQRMRDTISALGNPAGGAGFSSSSTSQSVAVRRIFNLVDDAFHQAARGATTISFGRRAAKGMTVVNILVTGFDPFIGTGRIPPGVINPSGAAAIALDGATVPIDSVTIAKVEGIVLPVSFDDFRKGMVENIVRPLVQTRGVDAILTVSLDESIEPAGPVRIERFVVGVHEEKGSIGAISASSGKEPGPAIIETPVPVEDIAKETERPPKGQLPTVERPSVGTSIDFRFPNSTIADRALKALGLSPVGTADITISDAAALKQIISTMTRAANGTDIYFQAGGQTFNAAVLSGPGGNFLSNEVSYRMLRLLKEEKRQDIPSFHVHVPRATAKAGDRIPLETGTREEREKRRKAISFAAGVRNQLIETLKRMIRAVAIRVAASINPPKQRSK